MYKEAHAAQAAEAGKSKGAKTEGSADKSGKKEEKVVDADFQEVDGDKEKSDDKAKKDQDTGDRKKSA